MSLSPHSPPRAFISGVQSEDVQLFLWLLWVAAQEAVSILMQIVDQIPIETVLSDDVNGACRDQNGLGDEYENEKQRGHELLFALAGDVAQKQQAFISSMESSQLHSRDLYSLACLQNGELKSRFDSFYKGMCSMKILPPRSVSLPDLVQAPSKFTMFKCGPR